MDKNVWNFRNRKRLRLLAAAAGVIWALLLGRLWYIQAVSHEELAEAAAAQYQVVVDGLDSRGQILDRNLQPLTGVQQQYYYFILRSVEDADSKRLLESIKAREISMISKQNPHYSVYRTAYFDETANAALRKNYSAYVFRTASRYSDTQTACHLIGYLNESEKKGVAGLEYLYEDTLASDGSRLALWADGSGKLLLNIAPVKEGGGYFKKNSLVTWIDIGLQTAAENYLQAENLTGAVLVSHAESGQILAWASSPTFNPNTLADYLESGGANLVDRCIQGTYAPGSVFKTVVAAAALEMDLADPYAAYYCTGSEVIEGVRLGCQAGPEGGHGEVDMYRAMTVSCNCYFAKLGEKLGAEAILDMAAKLGYGTEVFINFPEETSGKLPDMDDVSPQDISNISIGQGRLLATPIQVHQMMSVVACNGWMKPLTVTGEAENINAESKRVLSPDTARQLAVMLRMVMEEGTGAGFAWPCPVYGKTGTAESRYEDQDVNHCWGSGFCEVDGEKYVVTILIERGISGSVTALPLFQEICSYLTLRPLKTE